MNHTVSVVGTGFPTNATLMLAGVVQTQVRTNGSGGFSWSGAASGLGWIYAYLNSQQEASVQVTDDPPTIVNFRAVNNGNRSWTFSGQVQDNEPVAGLVVELRGIPSLDNPPASPVVQTNGTFSYTLMLQPGEQGGVVAYTHDQWGQQSNEATAYVWD
jgi:hypothetical protein